MAHAIKAPLEERAEASAYELLGYAWLDQFGEAWFDRSGTCQEDARYLAAASRIGKREFDALLPMMQHDLEDSGRVGFNDCLTHD